MRPEEFIGRVWPAREFTLAGMGTVSSTSNFSVNRELSEAEDRQLLAAYFGEATDRDLASRRLMIAWTVPILGPA